MAQLARTQRNIGLLATDGKPHRVPDALLGVTMVLGLAALVLSMWESLHVPASWIGLAGVLTGAWGQMISATTRERFLLILGLGAAGLGLFLAMARGGFVG